LLRALVDAVIVNERANQVEVRLADLTKNANRAVEAAE